MRRTEISLRLFGTALLTLVAVGSCFAEPNGSSRGSGGSHAMTAGGQAGEQPSSLGGAGGEGAVCTARPAVEGAQCHPAVSGEPLRVRVVDDTPQDTTLTTEQLFNQFNSLCGSCHVSAQLGGFQVSRGNFPQLADEKILKAMQSEVDSCELDSKGNKKDPNCLSFMPPKGSPNGMPWSMRKDDLNDPVTRLAGTVKIWLEAMRPADVFVIPADAAVAGSTPYAIDADAAEAFTNIGTCVPDAGMVATELEDSCALDAKFAALEKRPDSMDPAEKLGLPATLDQTDLNTWDFAELARHGVVSYVPTYPLWTDDAGKLRLVRVPRGESIRFNKKTKQFDIPKNTRFYKTFLKKILDRDGVERYRKIETRVIVSRSGEDSLFGTYAWNDTETQATLVVDPLHNGQPFTDQLFPVVTDVAKADKVYNDWKAGKVRNYSKELDYQHAQRRYAVPGSERCIQCHMGGPGESFVLAFSPLQLNNRPCDPTTLEEKGVCEGGIIEPAVGDNVTQLQRFIDYGIVTEYDPATQLVKLEDPQGKKGAWRNVRSPEELKAQGYMLGNCSHCHNPKGYPSVLNPELAPLLNFRPGEEGGIFEFPLERYSPRITRQLGKVKLPYITPSLRDIFSESGSYKQKRVNVKVNGMGQLKFIDAPWRSLIYRNVDTPFTYGDDQAIFPHMPVNSPGFDCRAPRIIGEWMVSVPALRKHPNLIEDVSTDMDAGARATLGDNDPQPYYEVKPTDAEYLRGVDQANKRLATFRSGLRDNNYCPDTSDIVDVWDILYGPALEPPLVPPDAVVKGLPEEGVPDRSHWVVTDLTDPSGDWVPRRPEWEKKLVEQNFAEEDAHILLYSNAETRKQKQAELDAQKLAVSILQGVTLTGALKDFVEKPFPMGVWQQDPGCDFSGEMRVKQYTGAEQMTWMDAADPEAPVFQTLPGAAIFNMICVNCHGPDADSRGRQAVTLQELTGGTARVANFRDGLFGPMGEHGANRHKVFQDDTAMKYLAWMALGGTQARIPPLILELVSATPVLGATRTAAPPVRTANMLETARELCSMVGLAGFNRAFDPDLLAGKDPNIKRSQALKEFLGFDSALITGNGDAELWQKLCTFENPAPIHGIEFQSLENGFLKLNHGPKLYRPEAYPANIRVGNLRGEVETSLVAANPFPWCVIEPSDPAGHKAIEDKGYPFCPASLITDENSYGKEAPEVAHFATRGAINAGLAVYSYLNQFISEGKGRALTFNECAKLNEGAKP